MTGSPSRRLVGFAGVLGTAVLLSGCTPIHAGNAAVVGSETISMGQVDDVARALCSANLGNGQSDLASRQARQGALGVLVTSSLARQFGAEERVAADPHQVSAAVAQNASSVKALPAEQRPAFKAALLEYIQGQLMVRAAGRKALQVKSPAAVTDARAQAAGSRLLQSYARGLGVTVDPRFGTYVKGNIVPHSGSLSVPVSPRATDGGSSDPTATWVASLPANQKCS